MRYSIAVAAFMAGAVTAVPALGGYGPSQISDGQIQVPTSVPATVPETTSTTSEVVPTTVATTVPETTTSEVPATTYAPHTLYSTEEITITSCGPTVKSCPASSTVVSTTIYPVPVTTPTSEATYPVSTPETSSTPVYVSTPVVVPTTPVVVPTTPVVPVYPSSPVYPIGTAPVVPVIPSVPVGTAPIPVGTAPVVPGVPGTSSLGNSPQGNTSPVAPYPAASTPAVPVGSGSPVAPVPIPSGTAIGSSGAVTGPLPTSSPIVPFTGAASTVGCSMAVAGFAAFAAIFLA